ncbi:S8 family peptidase [Allorhizocola rhizosphaerae]|uniref:S8 family peptidase n=1 Tax=Allorhizocola rhizosphaerae TaxID=1872709 RepID=UPI000E3D803A|nr:S8 family serine peptidase [Allorhizocola rhizosphaerae]
MRKATGLLAALILLLPTTTAAATPSRLHPPGEATILVTGDRVMARGNSFSIEPGKGRDRVTFTTKRVRGHLHVIPSDALIPLAEGRLDPRLFDVTAQAGRDLSLIVRPAGGRQLRGAKLTRSLPHLGLVSVQPHDRQALWADVLTSKTKVWLDGVLRPVLDTSVPQIGAPAAWQAGLTGAGVTMAVLDTSIDDTHPHLAGRVAGRMNFTEGTEDDRDTNGHGTHVASIMAGAKGVAPGANLLDAKVCVEWGCPESWVLAAMHWAVAQQRAKVVNLSLSGWDTPGIDPLEEAVDTLSAQFGTLVVIAAGNEGPFPSSVGTPGSADAALTVGAIDDAGEPASFSSRGPRLGDDGLKPDITAPGVDITAARSKDSPGASSHVALSGTSMATPHVAGAAALLAQRHPQWTGGQLKATLMASARPHATASVFTQGAGRVDVAAALTQRVYADPASIGFGMQLWPHGDDEP